MRRPPLPACIPAALLMGVAMSAAAVPPPGTGTAATAAHGAGSAAPVAAPPPARTVDVVDHAFGLALPDPYRWMEGDGRAELTPWLVAHGAYTRSVLDAKPGAVRWQQRLSEVGGGSVVYNRVTRAGDRLFYLRRGGTGTGTLMVREKDGTDRVLLDPATLADRKEGSITSFTPDPTGQRIAINLDEAGAEVSEMRILDVTSGAWLPERFPTIWGEFEPAWLPDATGRADVLSYTQMAPGAERTDGDPMQDMRTRIHVLGTDAARDPVLLRAGRGAGTNPTLMLPSNAFPSIDASGVSDWVIARVTGARAEQRACVAKRAAALEPGAKWNCIADFSDQVQYALLHGDILYLVSVKDAPNGRILAVDLSKPHASLADARVFVPMSEDAVVSGITLARDGVYVQRMVGGLDTLSRVGFDGGALQPITLPIKGSVPTLASDPRRDGIVFSLRGWTVPRGTYAYTPGTAALTDLGLTETTPIPQDDIVSEEVDYASADGTRVPMSIIHRRDWVKDGRNRALVVGYGGYGMPITPSFNPIYTEWARAGNVLVVAHVRGGGEKGDAWHRGGQGKNKYKGVQDFVGAAAALEAMGISSRNRVALYAGSMGGLLVGGAITDHPGEFGAAIVDVGILNPIRMLQAENGANQVAEIGDPSTADGLPVVLAQDPYQKLKPGVAYPPTLLSIGINDSRVSPWMTGKFYARMKAVTDGKAQVWIRTDNDAGHGFTSQQQVATAYADTYTFIEAMLPGR